MKNKQLKYAIYARVGLQSQSQNSLAYQTKILENIAQKDKLNLTVKFEEIGSTHGIKREVFANLLDVIKSGKVNAILTTSLDRLARGGKDGRDILNFMNDGKLIQIKTLNNTYSNISNGDRFLLNTIWLSLEMESIEKSRVIKRGLRVKNKFINSV